MGAKDSKPSFISYEDAVKRVTDAELKLLKDAFKRSSTFSGYMTRQIFIREVLGDGVPSALAEHIYSAFGGGSKGLPFKELLCGLVLLTKGSEEEKIKFLFGLYANDTLSYVQKEHMDKLVVATEGLVPDALSELFLENDRVSYESFRDWLDKHRDVTSVSRWLLVEKQSVTLSDDNETPTFYQTLAGVTHLEEADILELEKRYWVLKGQSKTGKFDLETFQPMVSPPIPEALVEGLFNAFDENRDNHIDFKEIACGISACCRGPLTERHKFCFKIFDCNHDGVLSKEELQTLISSALVIRKENQSQREWDRNEYRNADPDKIVQAILEGHDSNNTGTLSLEEYLLWSANHPLAKDFLDLLFEVCHIVLGLKPANREDEGSVVKRWVSREQSKGYQLNQVWYLVSMQWWNDWLEYVSLQNIPPTSSLYPGSPSSNNNRKFSKKGQKSKNGESLNSNFKTCDAWEDDSVVPTNIQTHVVTNQPTLPKKFNTLPRTGSRSSASQGIVLNPGDLSHSATPSPSHSPRLGKKRSSVNSTGGPQRPSQIDNSSLIVQNTSRVTTLTSEGGKLKKHILTRGRDYELLPEPVWKALLAWYGGSPALPRNVVGTCLDDPNPELELYPICVRLMRHQAPNQRPPQATTFTGMVSGIGGMALNATGLTSPPTTPRRYLAYTSCFSKQHTLKQVYDFLCSRLRIVREDMRLWKFKDEQNMTLLEEEDCTMQQLGIEDSMNLLIEVRNRDLTWPEEMSLLAKNKSSIDKKTQVPTTRGCTGLNNLGNTCFMNSAVQCVSNTKILTEYFNKRMHLYELNRENPLGMKGHIAQRYGELVRDIWSGTSKTIAPLKLRWTIGKYAPRFNGFQQHDAQELLAFLLDGLHEDLNRVHKKPYVELKDSDGRPDEVVAKEAWENHLVRNQSVVVDLFHGQLKSQVRCMECGHVSVRFDPFTYLSLPLPMESCIHLEIIVVCLDGSVPVKYGLRLNMDEKYKCLKQQLSELAGIPCAQILLVEVVGAVVKSFPHDSQKIRTLLGGSLYAYELPPPPEIKPMTVMEERGITVKEQKCLSEIQRMKTVSSFNKITNNNNPTTSMTPVNSVEVAQEAEMELDSHIKSLPTSPKTSLKHSCNTALSNGNGSIVDGNGSMVNGNAGMVNDSGSMGNGNGNGSENLAEPGFNGFTVAVHRKMTRMDVYFLSSQKTRPSLFGTPLVLPCSEETTNQDLYQAVWTQVARLVSPLPPSENNGALNHAQDCDDSLGYEYPFTLKVVQKDGFTCARCPWYRFCRGCKLECNPTEFNFGSCYIAIDWEPTALHLRYQTSQERVYNDHSSVEESRKLQTQPIDLDTCLKAFTKEEQLGEDELYYCSKCKELRLAAKKLDIWKLPPILIIHLKRFQFVNGRWVKSHKIVKYPKSNFDPSAYVATRMPKTVLKPLDEETSHVNGSTNHDSLCNGQLEEITNEMTDKVPTHKMNGDVPSLIKPLPFNEKSKICDEKQDSTENEVVLNGNVSKENVQTNRNQVDVHPLSPEAGDSINERFSDIDLEDTDLTDTDTTDTNLADIEPEQGSIRRCRMLSTESIDYSTARYDLYALSSHSGILGGGHYVSFAKNVNSKWYCYNDSSCKEVPEEQVDLDTAYMLFYERKDLTTGRYMPNVDGKKEDTQEIEDEFENDFKKMCSIQ